MSSNEIKEQLVDWYGGKEKDWKRLSKKKKGSYEVRVFENKTLGLIKTVVADDSGDCIQPEYFPTGEFWIYVNEKDIDMNNIDESKSYFDGIIDPWEYDFQDKDSRHTMVILKAPGEDYWYDQHCLFLIQDYFGVKDFSSMFDEPCENSCTLIKDIPVGKIREMCEKAGMKFLGYRNYILEQMDEENGAVEQDHQEDTTSTSVGFANLTEIYKQVNAAYFNLFPNGSKEDKHIIDELPWSFAFQAFEGNTKITKVTLGNTMATVIDDGSRWLKIKDDPNFKWYFYIEENREDNGLGFGVIRDNTLEGSSELKYNECGFHLCSQTFDLDPSFDEAAEMYIIIDKTKYPTREVLIEYLTNKGLVHKPEFDT